MMIRTRRGVTLIELLTVLGVVSLLALMVLPSVKSLLTDRKGTQTATLVRNFLEAARARAIGSGVPVAVVFERLSSQPADVNGDGLINDNDLLTYSRLVSATATDPLPAGSTVDTNFLPYNACIRLSMAEQPLPVTNAMLNTATPIVARPPASWVGIYFPPAEIRQPTLTAAEVDARRYFSIDGGVSNPVLATFFVAGNEVSFNKSTTKHLIVETKPDPTNNVLWFTTINSSGVMSSLEQAIPSTLPPPSLVGTTSFTIFLKPRSVNGPAIQLPKGTCVDLSLSGFSNQGNLALRDLSDPDFYRDARWRFSSAWLYGNPAFNSNSFPPPFAPSAQELRPIYIVFTPDGGLSRVYANSVGGGAIIPVETSDDFFLHIGKIDQVVVPALSSSVAQNLTDPSSYVVRLSPKSGAISAAPITLGFVSPTATIGDVLELSRQGTYGSQLTAQ